MLVKDNTYISIQSFMVTDLHLTGLQLLIYAIIYGFSQDGESNYKGSCQYLADWCGCSTRTVMRYLNDLMKKGLIEQVFHSPDNYEVHYAAVLPYDKMPQGLMTNCHKGTDKMSQGLMTKCHKAYDKMSQAINNNIADNIANNIADNIVVDETTPAPFRIPTIETVKTFAERHGKAVVDPVTFFEYYQANGWKVGKNKMKDWRAAFRMWEAREKKDGAVSGKPSDVPYMQKEYSKEHLAKKEADSMAELDRLLEE